MNHVNTQIPRLEKAFDLMSRVTVKNADLGEYTIQSSTDPLKVYTISYKREDCTCPDNQYRHVKCKHILAVTQFVNMTVGDLK